MKVLLNFHCSALYCISIIPSIKVFAELFSKSDRTLNNQISHCLNMIALHRIAITQVTKFLRGFQRGTFFKKFPFGVSFLQKATAPIHAKMSGIKIPLIFYEDILYFIASSTATATATVAPTIGLLPIPISPIIST